MSDALRPASAAVAGVFVLFALYDWFWFPPSTGRSIAAGYDIVLAIAGLFISRRRFAPNRVHMVTAMLACGVMGAIVVTTLSVENPMFSFYTAVLLIASAGTVMSSGWAITIGVMEIVAWVPLAVHVLPPRDLGPQALAIASGAVVAFIIQIARIRARARIIELRSDDVRREVVLQRALAEADEARRGLDRKVEERTAALRTELVERQRLEAQLRHAQKLEAVGRLAGGIAHDFNNLLTVIRMSLLTVTDPLNHSAADVRDAMRDATDATDRAAALTHDLLAFARKQTLERTQVAVGDILGGVERMVRRIAEASIRLEVTIADDVGEIVADRHQIEQVLLNLAINACDAMANRGTLAIRADAVELDGDAAAHHRVKPGAYVRVAVTDTGTGMDATTRQSIFEPFFTTKEVGRGTGLGLAVAHGIVTQHAGQIDVESELGQGSTFTVYLPRARGASQSGPIAVVKPPTAANHETVLVVEDEAAVRRAVHRNLARLGYRVYAACDGEDALRIAETLPGIDLLLTDVVMPGIDGPELALRLRDKWHDLPVLFVTGYSADRLARSGAVTAHDRVLEKPYQLEELARTIRTMIAARASRAA